MGIPRLRAKLLPYATKTILNGSKIVIDGPALAYYLFYSCQQKATGLLSALDIVERLLAWLEVLKEFNVEVEAIYFDGLLPADKLQTRMKRHVERCKASREFFQAFSSGCPLSVACYSPKKPGIANFGSKIPTTLFLVPAVLEALLESSDYGDKVCVVPGEADTYCAAYAAKHENITVVSGDSDLIIHALGPGGGVVFLADIEVTDDALRCLRFEPAFIELQLSLPPKSMIQLAYQALNMPQANARVIAKECLNISHQERQYQRFAEQYLESPDLTMVSKYQGFFLGPPYLDPRLSETTLRYIQISFKDEKTQETETPYSFLPALVDSMLETSAWVPSTSIRQIAYSLLQIIRPSHIKSVNEFRRISQMNSQGVGVDVLSHEYLTRAIVNLTQIMVRFNDLSSSDFLMAITLRLDIQNAVLAQRRPHSFKLVANASSINELQSTVSWALLHFSAQTQACAYSLRMIQQLLSFMSCNNTQEPESTSHMGRHLLRLLPPTGLPDLQGIQSFFLKLPGTPLLRDLCAEFGVDEPRVKPPRKQKATNTNPKTISQASMPKLKSPNSNNPFELLARD
ncbi:hypothetical protein CFIMG_000912RA [Ceratocystis fimbriata CBS 114723]|uniref:Asteroid domain-containing protein n=1 Tax=Ceratocystis fimbriata CBS 114723 TaxID=1035309 RepID=A0A2C5X824_9PEZI|nr:hypothetical protein CFIMG_000912RA [Ceratocystis fimbriata CBS 114723]